MPHDVHALAPDDLRAAHRLFGGSIHRGAADDAGWAQAEPSYSPGRTLGVRSGSALVGTATSFPSRTAVPGGAVLPTAAVTRVGVRADHTRRGVLSALMRSQLLDVAERGEPLATLRASEARIYGRFGYGVATRGRDVRVRAGRARWRDGAPRGGPVRLLEPEEMLPVLGAVHERLALRRAGGMVRPEGWWQLTVGRRVAAHEHVLAAVHTGAGGDDGFAVALVADGAGFSGRTLEVADLHAADLEATAGLWRFLLGIDLVGSVESALRPLDERLELLLTDPRDREVTGEQDETWLRIVDVPAALAARRFGVAAPVLIAVHDALLTGNAGVYRIAEGTAERVAPLGGPVAPDLECDVAGLAMAYLGDRGPSELVSAGWWSAAVPAAVVAADTAFAMDTAFATGATPWCGTFF